MRDVHITYMRDLAAEIRLGNNRPFRGRRFYETPPPVNFYGYRTPFVSIQYKGVEQQVDGKNQAQLPDGIQVGGALDGHRTRRNLKREYHQYYSYVMDFWVDDPVEDIHSDPLPVDSAGQTVNNMSPGIIDQALLYIANNRIVTSDPTRVVATPGPCALNIDRELGNSVYQLSVDINFSDGLYTLEELSTLDGASLRLDDPAVVK